MRLHWRHQPTMWAEVIRQGLNLSIGMGWLMADSTQQALVMSFVSALLAAINWSLVAPSSEPGA